MKKYRVTYKATTDGGIMWQKAHKIVDAISKEDAKKKADIWHELILNVELIKN
jgi:hypothetical protein